MAESIYSELLELVAENQIRKDYTRRAYHMLPKLNKPRILDVGCGTGASTLELARLSDGEIIGIDIDQSSLNKLIDKIEKAGISERVKAMRCSMFDIKFPDESFDLIWAEGSIFIIGFERGLKKWRRFIRPEGFLVVHEMTWLRPKPPEEVYDYWKRLCPGIRSVPEYVTQISRCGYRLIGHFMLPEDAWWTLYYHPLEKQFEKLRLKHAHDPEALALLDREKRGIDMYKKSYKWYGSAFFVMQKR